MTQAEQILRLEAAVRHCVQALKTLRVSNHEKLVVESALKAAGEALFGNRQTATKKPSRK